MNNEYYANKHIIQNKIKYNKFLLKTVYNFSDYDMKNIIIPSNSINDILINICKEKIFINLSFQAIMDTNNPENIIRFLAANYSKKYFSTEEEENRFIVKIINDNPHLTGDYHIRKYLISKDMLTKDNDSSLKSDSFLQLEKALKDNNLENIYNSFIAILHNDYMPYNNKESEIILSCLKFGFFKEILQSISFDYHMYGFLGSQLLLNLTFIKKLIKTKSKSRDIAFLKEKLVSTIVSSYHNNQHIPQLEYFLNVKNFIKLLDNIEDFDKNITSQQIELFLYMYKYLYPTLTSVQKQNMTKLVKSFRFPKYLLKIKNITKAINLAQPKTRIIDIVNNNNEINIQYTSNENCNMLLKFVNNNFEISSNMIKVKSSSSHIIIVQHDTFFVPCENSIIVDNINGVFWMNKIYTTISSGNIDIMLQISNNNLHLLWKET